MTSETRGARHADAIASRSSRRICRCRGSDRHRCDRPLLGVGRPDSHGYRGTTVVTDFPLTVTRVMTRATSAYAVGEVITLRVPAGSTDGLTMSVEDSPSVPANGDVFVFDRGQGPIAGGSSNSVLVVSNPADVFTVRSTSVVGQGPFVNVAEPLDRFVSHFPG